MVEGAIRHGTAMKVEGNYVDTHGQPEIGFGVTRLLNGWGTPGYLQVSMPGSMEDMAPSQEAAHERRASLVDQAVHQLRAWPALTFLPTAAGAVFTSGDREIVRLAGPRTAHLHLTTPVLDRVRAALCTCTHLETGADRGWVTIVMETSADLDLVLALISVAIKANDYLHGPARRPESS